MFALSFFEKPTDIYQIGVIVLLVLTIFESIFVYGKLIHIFKTGHEFNLKKQMSVSKKTDIIISELRALINADRISIVKFHNGSEFLPNNPIWKITSDNQVKADGVSYEDIESVLVSRIPSIMEPLITGEIDENSGVSIPQCCAKCPNKNICQDLNVRVIRFDVDQMQGYSKMFIQKRGTHTALVSTINNGEKKVFGLLVVEYIDTLNSVKEEAHIVQTMCAFTEKLRFLFA